MKKSTIEAKQSNKGKSQKPSKQQPKSSHDYDDYFRLVNLKNDNEAHLKTIASNGLAIQELEHTMKDPKLPLNLSAHAYTRVSNRLEELTTKNPKTYKDIMTGDNKYSLFIPSNLNKFIFDKVKVALKGGHITKKKSRSGGDEFIFDIRIPEWDYEDKECVLSMAVENNNIKTCYFNMC